MKPEGLKKDGTLKKGYYYAQGGRIVKKGTPRTPKTLGSTPAPSGKGLTFEKVWKMFQATDKKFQATDKKFQETREQMKETDRKLKELGIHVGGITDTTGVIAENIFQETFKDGITINGIRYKLGGKNINIFDEKGGNVGEIDLFLINGKHLFLIEVKYTRVKSSKNKLQQKAMFLKKYMPHLAKNKTIHVGVATLGISQDAKKRLLAQGVYIFTAKAGKVITYKPS